MLDLWPLKFLVPTWTQIYFFRNASSSWDKLNIVKTPWVLVGAASSISYCMNLYLASYLLCIGFKKMFRKLLKILNQQDPNFFLFVLLLLVLWFVYRFPGFIFSPSFSTLAHKVNEALKWHKIEKFDLWPQFTSFANEGPSSLHLHLPLSS